MIEVSNISKSYGSTNVLSDISFKIDKPSLIAICGSSGCGKTTLLNVLAGLLDFEGEITINGHCICHLSDKEKDSFRIYNIGFIFQDFKLFEYDTAFNNVCFPLSCSTNLSNLEKKRRVNDLLESVNLKGKANLIVKNFSGGEKQRVAIARALVNNARVILADEPTGALDEKSAHDVMNLIKSISKTHIVIMVSHDEDLVSEYADEIIYLEDGKIKSIYSNITKEQINSPCIYKNEYKRKRPSIPLSFLFKHTFNQIKQRKWRSIISNLVISMSLLGIGLAVSMSSVISFNIKNSCASMLDENRIIISKEETHKINNFEGAKNDEVENIISNYPDLIKDYGVIYKADFVNEFKDEDRFVISNGSKDILLNSYNSTYINEFRLLDECTNEVYPNRPSDLNDDEIVISLSLSMVHNICFALAITRTVESLCEYMEEFPLNLIMSFTNKEWEYHDEHIFSVVGFVLDYELGIYHSNHLWNQTVFEDMMRLPTNNILNVENYYPWTLKKLCYIRPYGDVENLLLFKNQQAPLDEYIFEVGNSSYFPIEYDVDTNAQDIEKLIVFKNPNREITFRDVDRINNYCNGLKNPIVGSDKGYMVMPDSLLIGFSLHNFFASDEQQLSQLLNDYSMSNSDINESIDLPLGIIEGHYSKTMKNGVAFKVVEDNLLFGDKPSNLNQIVVSTGFLNQLNLGVNMLNKQIYIGVITKEQKISPSKISREYKIINLLISGIVEDSKPLIEHMEYWPMLFYQTRVGISRFELGNTAIAFSVKDHYQVDDQIALLNKAFPSFDVSNPLQEINQSVDEVCRYIEVAMYAFSIIAVIVAILLLSLISYLHALEIKKDIGLARCIGVEKHESISFIYSHSFFLCLSAFLTSTVEVIIITFILNKIIGEYMNISVAFSFNPICLLYMFVVCFGIGVVTSIIVGQSCKKISPLDVINL